MVLNVQVCPAKTALMAPMASRDWMDCLGLMGKEEKEVKNLCGWVHFYPSSFISSEPEAVLLILVQSYWDSVTVKGLSAT